MTRSTKVWRSIVRLGPSLHTAALCAFLACSARSSVATAQSEHLATARRLANDGISAVEAGRCEEGLPLLRKAEKLHHALVHQRYIAQCLAEAGKLVAATEIWRSMIREGAPVDASPAVHSAVSNAHAQLDSHLSLLAECVIELDAEYDDVVLVLDGAPMPRTLVGAPQVLDPTEHVLQVSASGHEPRVYRWTLKEGGKQRVRVTLVPSADGPEPPSTTDLPADASPNASYWTPIGIAVGVAGVAALAGGTTAWIIKENEESDLARFCSDGMTCSGLPGEPLPQADFESRRDRVHTLTTTTLFLNIGGGVLAAAGVGLLIWDNTRDDRAQEASAVSTSLCVRPTVGGAALAVSGRF